jgi:hypothetical protein
MAAPRDETSDEEADGGEDGEGNGVETSLDDEEDPLT